MIIMDNCFFCSLLDSTEIYQLEDTQYFKAILDVNPSVMGQSLILSKNHQPFFPALSLEEIRSFLELLNKLRLNHFLIDQKDYNVLINNGSAAGQKVAHFSASYYPRVKNDNFTMFNLPILDISDEQLKKQFESFKKLFVQLEKQETNFEKLQDVKINTYKSDNILFETPNYYVFIDKMQFSPGHVKILPKYLDFEIKALNELSTLLKIVPIVIFEGLKPQGTNIIFDYFDNNFLIHVIPRYENDFSFTVNQNPYDLQLFLDEYNKVKGKINSYDDLKSYSKIVKKNELKDDNNSNKDVTDNNLNNSNNSNKDVTDNNFNNSSNLNNLVNNKSLDNENIKNNDKTNQNKVDHKLEHFKRKKL